VLHHHPERAQPRQVGVVGRHLADEECYRLVLVVGDENIVLVFLFASRIPEQRLQEGRGRQLLCPVGLAEENHRAERVGGAAVIIPDAVLEDFLQRAGLAGREDDAVRGERDQAVLADAVLKILGDVDGERRRRLVPVIPGRQGEALAMRRLAEPPGGHDPGVQRLHDPLVNLAVRSDDFAGVGGQGRPGALKFLDCRLKRGGSSRKHAPRCAASIAPGPPPLVIRNFSRQSAAEMRATPL